MNYDVQEIIPSEDKWLVRGWDGVIGFAPTTETLNIIAETSQSVSIKNNVWNVDYQVGLRYAVANSSDLWAPLKNGRGIVHICVEKGKLKQEEWPEGILKDKWMTAFDEKFFPTSYGVLVVGMKKIGLINKNSNF